MQAALAALRGPLSRVLSFLTMLWRRFCALPRWGKGVVVALIVALLFGLSALLSGGHPQASVGGERTVMLRSITELSGNAAGASVVGIVRSRNEAELRAEAGGTVRSVNTTLGASVPAGFVIAELENDSERAQVTQAEGAYDAALAARAGVSPSDVNVAARNAYRSAFDTIDTTLETEIDTVFGGPTPAGPDLLINPVGSDATRLSRERKRIDGLVDAERIRLGGDAVSDPDTLLVGIESLAREVATFLDEVILAANGTDSNASATQISALASARTHITGALSSASAARATLRSGSAGTTASVDASVKSALGTLRLAQAMLEKTRVRAPIGGTINYLPLRVGDYVANLDHVATVAQNGALEIVAYAGEDASATITPGAAVIVEDQYAGTITSLSPALDPVTKQIELHVAVVEAGSLVNGQSVRVTLPGASSVSEEEASGPALLPLAAVKLSAGSRVVFTMGDDGRLRALAVDIGEVVGERIQILTPLPSDLRIVTDARGLSDGQEVKVAAP